MFLAVNIKITSISLALCCQMLQMAKSRQGWLNSWAYGLATLPSAMTQSGGRRSRRKKYVQANLAKENEIRNT